MKRAVQGSHLPIFSTKWDATLAATLQFTCGVTRSSLLDKMTDTLCSLIPITEDEPELLPDLRLVAQTCQIIDGP